MRGAADLGSRPDYATLTLPQRADLVQAAWRSDLPRLLVFDNCEDPALLEQWRPPSGGCRVLVTSRRGEWATTLGVQALALGTLARPESVALLRSYAPAPDSRDDDLAAVAAEVGDLPLALHLAGSFLSRYRAVVTPGEYLAELRNESLESLLEHESMEGEGHSPTRHELSVSRCFLVSYEKLDAADPTDRLAIALLARAACLAPGVPIPTVPYHLLRLALGPDGEGPQGGRRVVDAGKRLVELGLLEADAESAYRLHPLLAAFAAATVPDIEEAQAAVEQAGLAILRDVNETGNPAPLLHLQPHLRHIADVCCAAMTNERCGWATNWPSIFAQRAITRRRHATGSTSSPIGTSTETRTTPTTPRL